MNEYVLLVLGTVLVNDFLLTKFLGLGSFIGVSNKIESAVGIGITTTFVFTLFSIAAWILNNKILVPLGIPYLYTLLFILVIAVVAQFTMLRIQKKSPIAYRLLNIFVPLISANCAVLGIALFNTNLGDTFLQFLLYSFGAAVGFSIVMVLFAAIQERIAAADVPMPFKGIPIALITAGLMSLAFMGFNGLAR